MKKLLPLVLLTFSVFGAQAPIYVVPPATGYVPATKQQTSASPSSAAAAELAAMAKTHKDSSAGKGTSEIMVISPEHRANDIQAAIKFLRLHVPTSKPSIKLTDGSKITNIMDVDVMPGGTILIFKVTSLKGLRYKIVNIEEVQTLSE